MGVSDMMDIVPRSGSWRLGMWGRDLRRGASLSSGCLALQMYCTSDGLQHTDDIARSGRRALFWMMP